VYRRITSNCFSCHSLAVVSVPLETYYYKWLLGHQQPIGLFKFVTKKGLMRLVLFCLFVDDPNVVGVRNTLLRHGFSWNTNDGEKKMHGSIFAAVRGNMKLAERAW
jgi:hypothetical protein